MNWLEIENDEIYDKVSGLIVKNFERENNLKFIKEFDNSIEEYLNKIVDSINEKGVYYFHSHEQNRVRPFPKGILSKCIGTSYDNWVDVPNDIKINTYIFFINEFKEFIQPLREKFSRLESTIEEDNLVLNYKYRISSYENKIKEIENISKNNEFSKFLVDAVNKTSDLLDELKSMKEI